jgi:MFS family permease
MPSADSAETEEVITPAAAAAGVTSLELPVLPPAKPAGDSRLWPVATVMATGIFATTFVQTQTLGYLPLNHLLTMDMHLDSAKAATFFSLAMMPWTFKTIAGLVVDGVPLFGSRRRSYLMLSALAAATMWLLMGFSMSQYSLLLGLAIAMNTAVVFASTTSGGLLVEAGQRFGMSGRLSSLRVLAQNLGAGLVAPVSGLLAAHTMKGSHPLFWTSIVAIGPLACMFFFSWFLLKEAPLPPQPDHGRSFGAQALHVCVSIWSQIKNVLRREMLMPALLLLFIQAVPTFRSTCFYQYQTGTLHYTDEQLGWLGFAGYAVALLSSGVYAWWCRRASLRTSLYGAIIVTSLAALPYLFYHAYEPYMVRAISIEGIGTFLQILAFLPLFDMAVRSTPKGSEALGYSLLIGVWNIGLMFGGQAGPWIYEHTLKAAMSVPHWFDPSVNFTEVSAAIHRQQMNHLIWLNAIITLAGLIIVFLLPKTLVEKREGK